MDVLQILILVALGILAVLHLLISFLNRNKPQKRMTPLAGVSFAFVLAGVFLHRKEWIGYVLLAIGMILAVIDIILKKKGK